MCFVSRESEYQDLWLAVALGESDGIGKVQVLAVAFGREYVQTMPPVLPNMFGDRVVAMLAFGHKRSSKQLASDVRFWPILPLGDRLEPTHSRHSAAGMPVDYPVM